MKLVDLLTDVHKQLKEAQRPPESGAFVLEACEITLGVEITMGGSGQLEFSIFGTGTKLGGDAKRAASHSLTFKFRPLDELSDQIGIDRTSGKVDALEVKDRPLTPALDAALRSARRSIPTTYMTGKKKLKNLDG